MPAYLLLAIVGLCFRPKYWPVGWWLICCCAVPCFTTIEAPEARYTLECFSHGVCARGDWDFMGGLQESSGITYCAAGAYQANNSSSDDEERKAYRGVGGLGAVAVRLDRFRDRRCGPIAAPVPPRANTTMGERPWLAAIPKQAESRMTSLPAWNGVQKHVYPYSLRQSIWAFSALQPGRTSRNSSMPGRPSWS